MLTEPSRGPAPGASGDEAAFVRLYEAMFPKIVTDLTRAFGSYANAEECAQQAFERAWKVWQASDIANPEAWITRIATRVALNRRAYERLRSVSELLRRLGRPAPAADPEVSVVGSELVAAIRTLPDRDRLIVLWYYDHGLSEDEIAERIGRSARTVRLRLAASRTVLREAVSAYRSGSAVPALRARSVESVEMA